MDQKIKKYFEIKAQVKALNEQLSEIRGDLKSIFGDTKADLTIDGDLVRIQTKKRSNKRCNWVAFKSINEELYDELVTENTSTYLELRKIVNG